MLRSNLRPLIGPAALALARSLGLASDGSLALTLREIGGWPALA